MKKNWKRVLAAGISAAVVLVGVSAWAAGNAGSSDDPLVTLSYLTQVFAPSLNDKVDEAVKANEEALKEELDAAIDGFREELEENAGETEDELDGPAAFKVVTLSKGQVLTGEVGCEVMLRIGTATCVSSSKPGLIDTTGAGTLNDGAALVTNHLYMITIETRGVKATSDTVKVLARGNYTVS